MTRIAADAESPPETVPGAGHRAAARWPSDEAIVDREDLEVSMRCR